MTLTAILLLVVSACIHAGWNLVCKRQHPSQTFFFLTGLFGTFLLLPVGIRYRAAIAGIPVPVWGLVAGAGFFMALYYVSLAGAYRKGDLSLAYPLARSSPILVVMFVSFVMGRGHQIGVLAVIGILLVVTGCFLLPMRRFSDFHPRNYVNACCLLALLAAIGTAGYTILDDHALAILRGPPAPLFTPLTAAFVYLFLEGFCAMCWQGIGLLAIPAERRRFAQCAAQEWKSAFLACVGIYLAYGLALTSMAFVTNVSYVAAFRQLSIPIGVAFGILLLKEPRPAPRLAGVAVMLAGLILVAVG